jgi:hypothetical protein
MDKIKCGIIIIFWIEQVVMKEENNENMKMQNEKGVDICFCTLLRLLYVIIIYNIMLQSHKNVINNF